MSKGKGHGDPTKVAKKKVIAKKLSTNARNQHPVEKKEVEMIDATEAYTPKKISEISKKQISKSPAEKPEKKKEVAKETPFDKARKINANKSLQKHDAWFEKYSAEIGKLFKDGKKKSAITKILEEKKDGNENQAMHVVYYTLNRLGLIETKNDSALVKRHDHLRASLKK
jgi:hypothetical protein